MADDEPEETPLSGIIFPRKLLKRFILMYKDLPCLWDKSCAAYKQKTKRHEAISQLTALVQEHDPTVTRVHVLRKIESLRACVRREHKRVRDSRRTAVTPQDIYKPHLWYYDLFSFVFTKDGFMSNSSTNSSCNTCKSEPAEHLQEYDEEHRPDQSPSESNDFELSLDPNEYPLDTSSVDIQSNKFDDDPKAKRHCTEVEDEYDAIGVNVAAKLRNLPPSMRILAEKLINDVLFQAQLNGLNSSTTISTQDPIKQDPMG